MIAWIVAHWALGTLALAVLLLALLFRRVGAAARAAGAPGASDATLDERRAPRDDR